MISALVGIFGALAGWLGDVLPQSPFADMQLPDGATVGLGWLNWFVPVGDMLVLMATVLGLLVVVRVAMYLVGSGMDFSKLATGGK